jgi:hypothetical protein
LSEGIYQFPANKQVAKIAFMFGQPLKSTGGIITTRDADKLKGL